MITPRHHFVPSRDVPILQRRRAHLAFSDLAWQEMTNDHTHDVLKDLNSNRNTNALQENIVTSNQQQNTPVLNCAHSTCLLYGTRTNDTEFSDRCHHCRQEFPLALRTDRSECIDDGMEGAADSFLDMRDDRTEQHKHNLDEQPQFEIECRIKHTGGGIADEPSHPLEQNQFFDHLDLAAEFKICVRSFKSIFACIRGPYKKILYECLHRLAAEIDRRNPHEFSIDRTGSCSFFFLVLCCLCHTKTGREGKKELLERVRRFEDDQIEFLLQQSHATSHRSQTGHNQRHIRIDKYTQAINLFEQGQLSRAAKVLHSAGLASGSRSILEQLIDPTERPRELNEPLRPEVIHYLSDTFVKVDGNVLLSNLRSVCNGSAPGPSGARAEYLKPLLEEETSSGDFIAVCNNFAQRKISANISQAICLCNMPISFKRLLELHKRTNPARE